MSSSATRGSSRGIERNWTSKNVCGCPLIRYCPGFIRIVGQAKQSGVDRRPKINQPAIKETHERMAYQSPKTPGKLFPWDCCGWPTRPENRGCPENAGTLDVEQKRGCPEMGAWACCGWPTRPKNRGCPENAGTLDVEQKRGCPETGELEGMLRPAFRGRGSCEV